MSIMRLKKKVFFVILLCLVSCGNNRPVDTQEADAILSELYSHMLDMDYKDIPIVQIDSLMGVYDKVGNSRQKGVVCLVKGAKLYADNNYMAAIDELKRAEQYVSELESEAGRLYYYLSRVLAVDNPRQSDYYARELVSCAEINADTLMLAFGNKLLMNLEEEKDSALIYRNRAVEMFELVQDTLMIEKTNARYGIKFMYEMPFDSAIGLILPFYERVGYERDADALATIYLLNNESDKAYFYIEKLKREKAFEFQYYNNLAVYYSQKGDFERSLAVYDSAFQIYQQQAMQILDGQIARVNGEYDKKLYDKQIELQRYRAMSIVLICILVVLGFILLLVWFIKALLSHKRRNMELREEKEKLVEEKEELVDTTKKQSQKLYAVSDICKNTYASIVVANPEIVKVIGRSLYDNLKVMYPQLSNMDFTYMFLDFIGLNAKEICKVLNVQEGTYYCRRSAIKKKMGVENEEDIDEIFNRFFLGETIE